MSGAPSLTFAPLPGAGPGPLIDTVAGIGFDQPGGTCGASKAELVESRTEHRDLLLTPGERAANDVRFVFVSLAEAGRPRLVLDP